VEQEIRQQLHQMAVMAHLLILNKEGTEALEVIVLCLIMELVVAVDQMPLRELDQREPAPQGVTEALEQHPQ
jgi:hypothetical protein